MYSIERPCSKRTSTLSLALSSLYRHKNSVVVCLFSVCILRPIWQLQEQTTLLEETFENMSEIH